MFNLPTLLSAALVTGTTLTAGLDGIDASVDSMIHAQVMQQKAVCTARVGAMLLLADQRPDAEATCQLRAEKEIRDKFAGVKYLIKTARI
jgi:hypothetical protein